MTNLYGELIARHWRKPQNFGPLESPDLAHEGLNPLCGDRVRIECKLDGARIAQARFRGDACMVATAAASLLTEMVRGLSLQEAAALPREQLLAALQAELRPARVACAMLPLEVLREAIDRHQRGAP